MSISNSLPCSTTVLGALNCHPHRRYAQMVSERIAGQFLPRYGYGISAPECAVVGPGGGARAESGLTPRKPSLRRDDSLCKKAALLNRSEPPILREILVLDPTHRHGCGGGPARWARGDDRAAYAVVGRSGRCRSAKYARQRGSRVEFPACWCKPPTRILGQS